MSLFEGKQEHPGWHFRLRMDVGWLMETQEAALDALEDMQEDFIGGIVANIVPAWEPLCGKLRHEVKVLTAANKISPDDLFDIKFELENIIARLDPK